MSTNLLTELAFKHKSERSTATADFYFNLLKDKQETVKKVLEIGIGGAGGLLMWRDFFPNAKIFGADNRGSRLTRRVRIESLSCDQRKTEDLLRVIEKTGSDLDLVIDDASHEPKDQLSTCQTIMPLLKKNVIYVIENVRDRGIEKQLKEYNTSVEVHTNENGTQELLITVQHKKNARTSVIVPVRGETREFSPGVTILQKTVQDIYENATGDIEVVVGFNGPPYQEFPDYPNLKVVKLPEPLGVKMIINVLAITASGKYIYKTDAHCKFGKGFDEILQADMQDNWVVTPRFYVLNGQTWEWQDERHYDYFYLSCPFTDPRGFRFKAGGHWPQLTAEREKDPKYDIDETPQLHGSGWFVNRDFFINKFGGFPNIDPNGHAQEGPYLGLKAWLGPWGGKLMVNKKTWYAHLHQDDRAKDFHYTKGEEKVSYDIWAKYWMGDMWEERVHNIDWFIDHFMPMPTWPENWRELLQKWQKENK